MNDDALAAVVAAAAVLLARPHTADSADAARWDIAARIGTLDAPHARLIRRARSRWALSGLLRD